MREVLSTDRDWPVSGPGIDVHALEFLRVNGPLANLPEFYQAYGVKPGDAMWRADSVRVAIW